MLKKLLKIFSGIIILILLLLVSLVTVIDMTPYQKMDYYKKWESNLGQFKEFESSSSGDSLSIGFTKVSLTPPSPTPMAGYGKRKGKHFESVHDSIWVRTLRLKKGSLQVAIVSADLLIIPPSVKDLVEKEIGENLQIYYGATHSHNSIGAWYNTLVGELFAGKYNPEIEKFIADQIVKSIKQSAGNLQPVEEMTYHKDFDDKDVKNRLIENGEKDAFIRSIDFKTADQRIALVTYSAHSTVLNSANMALSRDYPGVLVDSLENEGYDFATYLAGPVGSMGPVEKGQEGFGEMNDQAVHVMHEFVSEDELTRQQTIAGDMSFVKLPLPLRKPSPRISTKFALRPWVFKWLFGDAPSYITALKLDNMLLIGMPCDFSGELMEELENYASQKGMQLIITSFNGGYAGYITADEHFERNAYETITMNWFGPYNGAYFSEAVRDIIDHI